MLYGFLVSLYIINCFLLVLLILIQQSKGGMGIGALGGGSQMLFGASGGQDFLQKTTWLLAALFMAGSLSLALLKTRQYKTSQYIRQEVPMQQQTPVHPTPAPTPAEPTDNQ